MQFFNELGSLIEQRWKDQDYDEKVFPDVAAEALAEGAAEKKVDPWDIIRWIFTTDSIPNQQDVPGAFGNPPLTLFAGPKFYIDVYYWLDGTTSIHQHSFCGAFQVLLGSSILSHYRFLDRRQLNQHFAVGRMELEKVELLEQGAIRRILAGDAYIHSLFHLDRPSASICVRTHHTETGTPQYDYHQPSLAINPLFQEPLVVKRVQSASLLLKMEHPQADEMTRDLLARSDFQTALSVLEAARKHLTRKRLEKAFDLTTGEDRFQKLMEIARQRHGDLVDLLEGVFEEGDRKNNIIHRRSQITSSEHRFFLALLLNVRQREPLLELVRVRFPERDPIETIMDWVDELANTRVLGGFESNTLGIDDFDDDYLFVLECMFEGCSLEETINRIDREMPAPQGSELRAKAPILFESIRRSILFGSIFSDLS